MTTVNMHEAKTQLSRLVDAASRGDVITIAKAGRPVARLTRIDASRAPRRIGFLAGQAQVPEDFDTMASDEVAELFQDEDR